MPEIVVQAQASSHAPRSCAPDARELATVSPLERLTKISAWARRQCTLPAGLAAMRRAALAEARAAGHTVAHLAEQMGVTPSRVSQLSRGSDPRD